MADEVRRWLAEVDCEKYFAAFIQNGFSTLASLKSVNDAVLNRMAVFNPTHRQAILRKCRTETGINVDFDSILKDLDCAIEDLESFAAPRQPGASVEPKITTPIIPVQQPRKDEDFDLDALFRDLEPFDPMANSVTPTSAATEQSHSHQRSLDTTNEPSPHQNAIPVHGQQPDGPKEVMVLTEPKLTAASEEITCDLGQQQLEERTAERKRVAERKRAAEQRGYSTPSEEELKEMMKDEKIRIALEKIKIASKRKSVIMVFNSDGSNMVLKVEERMTAAQACDLLVKKNHFEESPNWSLVEKLEDVWLERDLEDHEFVEEVYSRWSRNSSNQFFLRGNDSKYDLFTEPIKYFPTLENNPIGRNEKEFDENVRRVLVEDGIMGHVHVKDGYKGKWRRVYMILRLSGLYQTLRGKQKNAKNLQLLVKLDECDLYRGVNPMKFLKAKTNYCFALRPRPDKVVHGSTNIQVFCSDSQDEFLSWYAGIRLAMQRQKLYDNYNAYMKRFKLEETDSSVCQTVEKTPLRTGNRLKDKKREYYVLDEEEMHETHENAICHLVIPSEEDDGESATLHKANYCESPQTPPGSSYRIPFQSIVETLLEPLRIQTQLELLVPPRASLESSPQAPSDVSFQGTLESAEKLPTKTPPEVHLKPSNVNKPAIPEPASRPDRAPEKFPPILLEPPLQTQEPSPTIPLEPPLQTQSELLVAHQYSLESSRQAPSEVSLRGTLESAEVPTKCPPEVHHKRSNSNRPAPPEPAQRLVRAHEKSPPIPLEPPLQTLLELPVSSQASLESSLQAPSVPSKAKRHTVLLPALCPGLAPKPEKSRPDDATVPPTSPYQTLEKDAAVPPISPNQQLEIATEAPPKTPPEVCLKPSNFGRPAVPVLRPARSPEPDKLRPDGATVPPTSPYQQLESALKVRTRTLPRVAPKPSQVHRAATLMHAEQHKPRPDGQARAPEPQKPRPADATVLLTSPHQPVDFSQGVPTKTPLEVFVKPPNVDKSAVPMPAWRPAKPPKPHNPRPDDVDVSPASPHRLFKSAQKVLPTIPSEVHLKPSKANRPAPPVPAPKPARAPKLHNPRPDDAAVPPTLSHQTLESAQKVPCKTPPEVPPKPSKVHRPAVPVPAPRPARASMLHKPRPDEPAIPPTSPQQPPLPLQRKQYPDGPAIDAGQF